MKIRYAPMLFLLVFILSVTSCDSGSPRASDTLDSKSEAFSEGVGGQDTAPDTYNGFTVVIDPGHGFGDPGSQPEYLHTDEAVVTLKAALCLRERLQAAGVKAVLTHDGTSFVHESSLIASADRYRVKYDPEKIVENNVFSAYERVIYANVLSRELGNCFFISLHTNSLENDPTVSGMSADYYAGSTYSALLHDFCEDFKACAAEKLNKKTVVFADSYEEAYIVNKYCDFPSVLIELGYGSNPDDARLLESDIWIGDFCDILAELLEKYAFSY